MIRLTTRFGRKCVSFPENKPEMPTKCQRSARYIQLVISGGKWRLVSVSASSLNAEFLLMTRHGAQRSLWKIAADSCEERSRTVASQFYRVKEELLVIPAL